jgi:hypothetical protein
VATATSHGGAAVSSLAATHSEDRLARLLDTGMTLASELSLPTLLQRIVELAAGITGARYGALGSSGATVTSSTS